MSRRRSLQGALAAFVLLTGLTTPQAVAVEPPQDRSTTNGAISSFGGLLGGLVDEDLRPTLPVWGQKATRVSLSADGARVAFFEPVAPSSGTAPTAMRIVVMGPDGSSTEVARSDALVPRSHLTWSADGTRLAFSGIYGGNNGVWVVPADGSAAPVRVHPSSNAAYRTITHVAWSPVGNVLALVRGQWASEDLANHDVYLLDLDSGALRQLTQDCVWPGFDEGGPLDCGGQPHLVRSWAWTPDGRALVGIRHGAGRAGVVEVDVATGDITKVFSERNVRSVMVSPDGRLVAYTALVGGSSLLSVYDLRTGATRVVHPKRSRGPLVSWQACPGGDCASWGEPLPATTMATTVKVRRHTIRLAGTITPAATKLSGVLTVLKVRAGSGWREVKTRSIPVEDGVFVHRMRRPDGATRCRLRTHFAGSPTQMPATQVDRFRC